MPPSLTSSDRRILLAAGLVSLVLVIVSVVLTPVPGDTTAAPTTYSVAPEGAKAAYLLLERSGYQVRRWEMSFRELPADATLILADPEEQSDAAEKDPLRHFVEGGGRLIATGPSSASFVETLHVAPEQRRRTAKKTLTSKSLSPITRAAPEISMVPEASWDSSAFAVTLYGDDRPRVVEYALGRGRVVWWASATPLTNAGIREKGNLEFFLACLGGTGGGQTPLVLWDEYDHGHRLLAPARFAGSPFKWAALPAVLLVGAVLLTYSRRSGPVVVPMAESRLSPLEFVSTLGGLYQRAGAASVAVDIAYQRFRHRLATRLGLPGDAAAASLERAVRDRWRLDDPAFGALLRACESAHGSYLDSAQALHLTQSLADYAADLRLFSTTTKERA